MQTRLQRSLVLLGVFLAGMLAVASGTGTPSAPSKAGYARLLEAQAPMPADPGSLIADCVMEGARLRLSSGSTEGIPTRQFEELRAFCRKAARLDNQQGPRLGTRNIPKVNHAAERKQARQQSQDFDRLDRTIALQDLPAKDKTR